MVGDGERGGIISGGLEGNDEVAGGLGVGRTKRGRTGGLNSL